MDRCHLSVDFQLGHALALYFDRSFQHQLAGVMTGVVVLVTGEQFSAVESDARLDDLWRVLQRLQRLPGRFCIEKGDCGGAVERHTARQSLKRGL